MVPPVWVRVGSLPGFFLAQPAGTALALCGRSLANHVSGTTKDRAAVFGLPDRRVRAGGRASGGAERGGVTRRIAPPFKPQ